MFSRRGALTITLAVLLGASSAACIDRGPPSTEEQLESLGLPLDSLMDVDEATQVTVHVQDGKPVLLIFTPQPFGGSDRKEWVAERPSVNGGLMGDARSSADVDGQGVVRYEYLFGAGQGPIDRVEVTDLSARAEVVNPETGAWVIVVPAHVGVEGLEWDLIGLENQMVYSGIGWDPRQ